MSGNGTGSTSDRLLANIERVVLGKHEEIALVLAAMAADGHVLLEDVPGTAKTILARVDRADDPTVRASRGSSARPTSSRPTSPGSRSTTSSRSEFEFRPGPIFANIVLVDEINRAMPKTQSALLEAMAEQPGDRRRRDATAAVAVPRDRDREPDRAGGHVPAPRGAARPLRAALGARLPGRGGGDRDRAGAATRASARRARAARVAQTRCGRCRRTSRTSTSTS